MPGHRTDYSPIVIALVILALIAIMSSDQLAGFSTFGIQPIVPEEETQQEQGNQVGGFEIQPIEQQPPAPAQTFGIRGFTVQAAGTTILSDTFDSPPINSSNWNITAGNPEVSDRCSFVSSPNASVFGGEGAAETIESVPLDTSSASTIGVAFWWRQGNSTGGCDEPDPNEDLVFSYNLSNGTFATLATFLGSTAGTSDFNQSSFVITDPLAFHPNFKLRIQNTVSGTNLDFWGVDDVSVVLNASIPIGSCTNITTSGSYALNQSISANQTCIEVQANDTMLDCQGFNITFGTGGGNDARGINAVSQSNITVQNCNIVKDSATGSSGFGVKFAGVSNSAIFNNNISVTGAFSSRGIALNAPSAANSNNSISGNTIATSGTSTDHYGIQVDAGTNNSITSNIISTSGTGVSTSNIGIYYGSNAGNIISNSITTAGHSFNHGISTSTVSSNNISGNTIVTSGASGSNHGMQLFGSNSNVLGNNNVTTVAIDSYGFYVFGSSHNRFLRNSINVSGATSVEWRSEFTDAFPTAPKNNTATNLTLIRSNITISLLDFNGTNVKAVTTAEAPANPGGFLNISKYVNATNNSADSWLFLNVSYSDAEVSAAGVSESTLRIAKHNGTWETNASVFSNVNGVDTTNNVVFANITNFGSTFAPLAEAAAGPTNISSCTNITSAGTYLLNQSITNSADTVCMLITANDVTLDCAGFTIDGTDSPTSKGVEANLITNIAVENCVITDWSKGISSLPLTSSLINNNTFTSNGLTIDLAGGSSNNNLTNNIITSSSSTGISFAGSGSGNRIENNTVTLNTNGMSIQFSDNNLIQNNTFDSHTQRGIFLVDSSSNNIFINNSARNNTLNSFSSQSGSINNTIINLEIGSTTISFTSKDIGINNASSPGSIPAGFAHIGKFVDATNNSADSFLFLNVSYTDSDVSATNITDESSLRIAKHNSTVWVTNTSAFAGSSGIDAANNIVFANITDFGSTFAPLGVTDATAPNVAFADPTPANGSIQSSTSVTINVTVTDDLSDVDSCVLEFDSANSTMTKVGSGTSVTCNSTVSSLSDGIRAYRVFANDTAGNSNSTETRVLLIDATAPAISNISVTDITTSSAVAGWLTNEAANSTVSFGINVAQLNESVTNSSLVTARNLTLSSLSASTIYFFNVTSCDALGNCNTTGPDNFTTTAAQAAAPALPLGGPSVGVEPETFEIELQPGEAQEFTLDVGDSLEFQIGEEDHSIRVTGVFDDTVELEFNSHTFRGTFNVRESKRYDLTENGVDDIEVSVVSKTQNSIRLRVRALEEVITVIPEQPILPPVPPVFAGPVAFFFAPLVETTEGQALLALIIISVVSGGALLVFRTAKRRRERKVAAGPPKPAHVSTIERYVAKEFQRGHTEKHIRQELAKIGWSRSVINEALRKNGRKQP